MNYINLIEEAIKLFKELASTTSAKEKRALLDEIKGNEFADELLGYLKDKAIHLEKLALPAAAPLNEGRVRLQHFLNFTKAIAEGQVDEAVMAFLFRKLDEEEQHMYQAILSTNVSLLPEREPAKAKPKKEEKKQEEVVEVI